MEFYISPIDRTKPTLVLGDQTKFVSLSKWQFSMAFSLALFLVYFKLWDILFLPTVDIISFLFTILIFHLSFFFFFCFRLPHVACGILVPWRGTELGPSAVKSWCLNQRTTREFLHFPPLYNTLWPPDPHFQLPSRHTYLITLQTPPESLCSKLNLAPSLSKYVCLLQMSTSGTSIYALSQAKKLEVIFSSPSIRLALDVGQA